MESFDELETTREKFSFLLELAEELPDLQEFEKTPENKLKGCASNAWITLNQENNKWSIKGSAEAQISKGMLGFLSLALSGLTSQEIQNIPAKYLEKNKNFSALSPSRHNGFLTAMAKIRTITIL